MISEEISNLASAERNSESSARAESTNFTAPEDLSEPAAQGKFSEPAAQPGISKPLATEKPKNSAAPVEALGAAAQPEPSEVNSPRNILAVDTASTYLSVAVIKGEEVFRTFLFDAKMKHSVLLLAVIDETLKKAGLNLRQIDLFAVVTGAGSFTGIRIGVATVRAFAKSTGKKVIPVTSFEVLSYNKKEPTLAVIDAGHGHCYAAGFGGTEIPPVYIENAAVSSLAAGRTLVSAAPIPGIEVEIVSPETGLIAAVRGKISQAVSGENVHPLYIRKSQAEEHR